MKTRPNSTGEKAVLIGIELPGSNSYVIEDSLEELRRLAETAGAEVVDTQVQRRKKPDPAVFIGKGKAREIVEICRGIAVDIIICDRELSPAQANNLADITGMRVLDRTQLILDIFAGRARTKEGKLQVELAQLEYMLPRLVGSGVGLSRLGGGIGTRGPGETKLEIDRRRIRKRITDLKKEINEVRKHREIMRRGRREVPLPVISMVGYTNAGKSTLLNTLTGAGVLVEDKLFATLDPTTRKVKLPNNQQVLITDTVGFINNLPHRLVAAFHATLEEVEEADILLHVVDAGHPAFREQIDAVNKVLKSLQTANKPVIMAFNKTDTVQRLPLYPEAPQYTAVISARTGEGVDELLSTIQKALSGERIKITLEIPYNKSSLLDVIYSRGKVIEEKYHSAGTTIEIEIDRIWAKRIQSRLND